MIQEEKAVHKGIDIELNVRPLQNGKWSGDYTLVEHKGSETVTTPYSRSLEFETVKAARESALEAARQKIDRTK